MEIYAMVKYRNAGNGVSNISQHLKPTIFNEHLIIDEILSSNLS